MFAPMGTTDPTEMAPWFDHLERRLAVLDQKIAQLSDERRSLVEILNFLRQKTSDPPPLDRFDSKPSNQGSQLKYGSVREYVIAKTRQLLAEEGGTLHIHEIHARFLSRGFEVPGAGEPVNITAHIRHDRNIVSPAKGMYKLKDS